MATFDVTTSDLMLFPVLLRIGIPAREVLVSSIVWFFVVLVVNHCWLSEFNVVPRLFFDYKVS